MLYDKDPVVAAKQQRRDIALSEGLPTIEEFFAMSETEKEQVEKRLDDFLASFAKKQKGKT